MDDCERFLEQQKPWIRAILKGEYRSPEILTALAKPGGIDNLYEAWGAFEVILSRCRKHLREYRDRNAKEGARATLFGVPSAPAGAPRKDALAEEAAELKQKGLSYARVARELNRKHGPETTNAEAIRSLLRSRKAIKPPEKT